MTTVLPLNLELRAHNLEHITLLIGEPGDKNPPTVQQVADFLGRSEVIAAVHSGDDIGVEYAVATTLAVVPDAESVACAGPDGTIRYGMHVAQLADSIDEAFGGSLEEDYGSLFLSDHLEGLDAGRGNSLAIVTAASPYAPISALMTRGGYYSLEDGHALVYPDPDGLIDPTAFMEVPNVSTVLTCLRAGNRRSFLVGSNEDEDYLFALHHFPQPVTTLSLVPGSAAHHVQDLLAAGPRVMFGSYLSVDLSLNSQRVDELNPTALAAAQDHPEWRVISGLLDNAEQILGAPAPEFLAQAAESAGAPMSLSSAIRTFSLDGGPDVTGGREGGLPFTRVDKGKAKHQSGTAKAIRLMLTPYEDKNAQSGSLFRFMNSNVFVVGTQFVYVVFGAVALAFALGFGASPRFDPDGPVYKYAFIFGGVVIVNSLLSMRHHFAARRRVNNLLKQAAADGVFNAESNQNSNVGPNRSGTSGFGGTGMSDYLGGSRGNSLGNPGGSDSGDTPGLIKF